MKTWRKLKIIKMGTDYELLSDKYSFLVDKNGFWLCFLFLSLLQVRSKWAKPCDLQSKVESNLLFFPTHSQRKYRFIVFILICLGCIGVIRCIARYDVKTELLLWMSQELLMQLEQVATKKKIQMALADVTNTWHNNQTTLSQTKNP